MMARVVSNTLRLDTHRIYEELVLKHVRSFFSLSPSTGFRFVEEYSTYCSVRVGECHAPSDLRCYSVPNHFLFPAYKMYIVGRQFLTHIESEYVVGRCN